MTFISNFQLLLHNKECIFGLLKNFFWIIKEFFIEWNLTSEDTKWGLPIFFIDIFSLNSSRIPTLIMECILLPGFIEYGVDVPPVLSLSTTLGFFSSISCYIKCPWCYLCNFFKIKTKKLSKSKCLKLFSPTKGRQN